MVRTAGNGSLDCKSASDMSESLAAITADLAAAVAATPNPDREPVFKEITRLIRDQVRIIDDVARNHLRSRSLPIRSTVASSRRPSRKARVGVEDLEGRVVPSIMTITVTNHGSPQVRSAD
jgi:hypothetical protein